MVDCHRNKNTEKLVVLYKEFSMGVVIKISKKSKPEETRKALDKLASERKKRQKNYQILMAR